MKRLSIFSSKAHHIPIWRGYSPSCLALALFLTARLLLYLCSDALLFAPESHAHKSYLANEIAYRQSGHKHPRVVVMGTSRLGSLPIPLFADKLGLNHADVANYSLAGNNFWRTLTFFRRNPEILTRAEFVVIDLLPYQLYVGPMFDEQDSLFLRLATLDERLAVRDPYSRAIALADLALPAWSERRTPPAWLRAVSFIPLTEEQRYQEISYAIENRKTTFDLRPDVQIADVDDRDLMGSDYVPPPCVSEVQIMSINALAELMPSNCQLTLVWLPIEGKFARALLDDENLNESYELYRRLIERYRGSNTKLIWWERNDELEALEHSFIDAVHYSPQGMACMTNALANTLLNMHNSTHDNSTTTP